MSAQDNVIRIGTHLWTEYQKTTPKKLQVIPLTNTHQQRTPRPPAQTDCRSTTTPSRPTCPHVALD